MQTWRVFQQAEFAHDRLADFIADTRAQASAMPEGAERTERLQRILEAEAALKIERWASSPELQPPK
jgi:hypothetical protein